MGDRNYLDSEPEPFPVPTAQDCFGGTWVKLGSGWCHVDQSQRFTWKEVNKYNGPLTRWGVCEVSTTEKTLDGSPVTPSGFCITHSSVMLGNECEEVA